MSTVMCYRGLWRAADSKHSSIRMSKYLLFFLILFPAFPQSVVVYDLTTQESKEGARLNLEMTKAAAAFDAWKESMGAKYAKDSSEHVICCHEKGHGEVDFDDKFRHAVPEKKPSIVCPDLVGLD